jgi:hypothetical protein
MSRTCLREQRADHGRPDRRRYPEHDPVTEKNPTRTHRLAVDSALLKPIVPRTSKTVYVFATAKSLSGSKTLTVPNDKATVNSRCRRDRGARRSGAFGDVFPDEVIDGNLGH